MSAGAYRVLHHFLGLEAVAGYEGDRGLRRLYLPHLRQPLERGHGHAARGLREYALSLRQQLYALGDLLLRHGVGVALGLVDHLEGVVAVGGIADCQRLGDGVRLHGPYGEVPGVEGV